MAWSTSRTASPSRSTVRRRSEQPAKMASMSEQPATTHFGYRDVPVADKQKLVGAVFTSVAHNYDLMNDLMSFGVHRLWKRHFIAISGIRRGDRVLDLAGGTGDIAALLKPVVGETGEIVVGDINAAMLEVGRDRLTDKDQALADIYRVLKPGGRLLVLEFSRVRNAALGKLYDFHSFQVLPRLGRLFAHDADSYQYLAESIRKHPDQETLKGMLEHAGFGHVEVRNLTQGIVAIHRGYKF